MSTLRGTSGDALDDPASEQLKERTDGDTAATGTAGESQSPRDRALSPQVTGGRAVVGFI
jgi:hypothetical protein